MSKHLSVRGSWNAGLLDTHWQLHNKLSLSSLNVGGEIDLVGQLRDVHLEPLLDLIQRLGIRLVTDEGNGQAFGSKPMKFTVNFESALCSTNVTIEINNQPASPGNSVQVCVGVLRHVVVEDNVDALDVHATAEEVGGNKNPLLEILELLIPVENKFEISTSNHKT